MGGTQDTADVVERDIATLNQVLDAFMQKVERIQHDLRIDPDARDSTTLYKLYKHIVTLEDRIAALSALPTPPVAVTEAMSGEIWSIVLWAMRYPISGNTTEERMAREEAQASVAADKIMALVRAAVLGAGEPPVEEIDWDRFTVVYLGTSWKAPEGEFLAVVRDREQGRPLIGKDFEGIGPTIDAALRDAVANAKGGGA